VGGWVSEWPASWLPGLLPCLLGSSSGRFRARLIFFLFVSVLSLPLPQTRERPVQEWEVGVEGVHSGRVWGLLDLVRDPDGCGVDIDAWGRGCWRCWRCWGR
jgi:hypothetical protein